MYGKVNNKIDVYAYGVVLLELLSGRKPISSDYPKGQESLVMWVRVLVLMGFVGTECHLFMLSPPKKKKIELLKNIVQFPGQANSEWWKGVPIIGSMLRQ